MRTIDIDPFLRLRFTSRSLISEETDMKQSKTTKDMVVLSKNVFQYIDNVSDCRMVSKQFVPLLFITKVIFHRNYDYERVVSFLSQRPFVKTVIFFMCSNLYQSQMEIFIESFPSLDMIEFKGCEYIISLPRSDRFRYVSELERTTITIQNDLKTQVLNFPGCWNIFQSPLPSFTHVDVVELFLSTFATGSSTALRTVNRFYIRGAFMSIRSLNRLAKHESWLILSECVASDGESATVITRGIRNRKETDTISEWTLEKRTWESVKCWMLVELVEKCVCCYRTSVSGRNIDTHKSPANWSISFTDDSNSFLC